MIPYARQSIARADVDAVVEVLNSDYLTQGEVVPAFERALAEFCGAAHAVAVSNATSALHLAVAALGLGPGDLLWTSPISFVASANCGRYCGAEVEFVDIDPRTYTIDPQALGARLEAAERIGRLPKVVVIVDFAGQPCALDQIGALRRRYGFAIVEDASHAIGSRYRGARVGAPGLADVTVFSFHPVKIITTGEGGAAVTEDAGLAARMALLRSHGVTRDPATMLDPDHAPWEYEQIALGYNYRLTEIQAALGMAQLRRIDGFLARRRRIAARYDAALAGLPLVLPYQARDAESAYHLYPIQVEGGSRLDRRGLYDALRERGIGTNVHYIPIESQPYYRERLPAGAISPVAQAYYRRALSLPMYAALADDEQDRVIETLRALVQ